MIDPIGSEAIAAKAAIVDFASWIISAKHTALAEVVRKLERMIAAAYERGRDSLDRERLKQNTRRTESDIDSETERDLIDHGV